MPRARVATILGVSLLVGLGSAASYAQKPDKKASAKADQELMQIERDWCSAVLKKDVALLGRILHDDYTAVLSSGRTSTKANEIADLKSGAVAMTACTDDHVKARVYGDAAVVTGRGTRSGATKERGAFKNLQFLWTDTFVRQDGRWQCVASQATIVAEQQKK